MTIEPKMAIGKTITMFLVDGTTTGITTCELSNWTGKALKIPRTHIKQAKERDELNGTGVYILLWHDEVSGKPMAYIGESELISKRLEQHLSREEYWTEAIVFVSKDDNLNKAHIKYLENSLYSIASEIGKYGITNSNNPKRPKLSESDEANMEEFIINVRLLTGALGIDLFEKLSDNKQTRFYAKRRGANACGITINKGFEVLKNSVVSPNTTPSIPQGAQNRRSSLIKEGIIANNGEALVFTKDYTFTSPSTAAAIVLGCSANGLAEWKTAEGITLKDYEMN